MKSRSKELLDRAIAATVAAIEIYNKPDFQYREEAFSVLAINGWELLLKAKWLADHGNEIKSLYVMQTRTKKDGQPSKILTVKTSSRTGNAFTHGLDYLAKKLVEAGRLDVNAFKNLEALLEVRDSAVHFYNRSAAFSLRLQEIGTASLKNFVTACRAWFGRDLGEFNFYLMPLSFIALPKSSEAIVLNAEEKRFLAYIENLEPDDDDGTSPYSVTVNIDIKFTRATAKEALGVRLTDDPNAPAVRLTDEQIREKFPWCYDRLTIECQKRYSNFKVDRKYHGLRNTILTAQKHGAWRYLDPGNPKSSKKPFFNPNILQEFDRYYSKLAPPK